MKIKWYNKVIVLVIATFCIVGSLVAYNRAYSGEKDILISKEQSVNDLLYTSSDDVKKSGKEEAKPTLSQDISTFYEIIRRLQVLYVDEVDSHKLIEDAIKGMLKGLDPHTNYFDKDAFTSFTSSTKGEFGGLGIQIDKKGDFITVVSPIQNTPAYRLGIQAGDMIWKVNGEDCTGITTEESIKKMRGKVGSEVNVTILRPGVKEPLDFKIIREKITINSITNSFMMDKKVGYVRMSAFNANTTKEFDIALDKLEKDGMKALIIDLRYNPGGLLSEAISTVNEFVGPDKRVVFTKGRIPMANNEYFTERDFQRDDYPIIVLINESSASAAEIFSGSMQDYDRGLVLGQTSFGKGSVQQLQPLRNGGGIKITTSHYYINSGRCIHKLINDKILTGKKVTKKEKDEIEKENKEHIYHTLKGRVVYGGGGINPDITVKADTLTRFEIELRRKNYFFDYAVEYMLDNEEDVDLSFRAKDSQIREFLEFVKLKEEENKKKKPSKEDEVEEKIIEKLYKTKVDLSNPTDEELSESWDFLRNTISAEIIEKKFGSNEGYKVRISSDTQLNEALRILDKYDNLDDMFDYAASIDKRKKDKK